MKRTKKAPVPKTWAQFQIAHPKEAQAFLTSGDWPSTDDKPEDFTFTMKGGKFFARKGRSKWDTVPNSMIGITKEQCKFPDD